MAPIKFENDIKEKLEQRELQPSANVWGNLEKQLDANDKKKNNKGFWWFGLAASFVGILIISSVFFNREGFEEIEPVVVDVEAVEEPNNSNDLPVSIQTEEKVAIESIEKKSTIETKKNPPKKAIELVSPIQQKQNALIKGTVKDVVVQTEIEYKKELKDGVGLNKEKLSFEDIKIQEVVALVQALKEANTTVSDVEINALLDQAQKDITLHKLYNEATNKVDANALLQDVETDLEQSFRDKAFKAIQSGYKYVKTAVVDRNN